MSIAVTPYVRNILLLDGLVSGAAGVVMATVLAAAGIASSRVTWVPFAVALAACLAIGLASGIHPARRAARVDPAVTLRERRI